MNKQKKLKLILSSFKQKQLIKFFQTFLEAVQSKFYKSIKQISFSCYQSTCQVQNYMVNGYGKTSSEALISGINNLIDCLIQQQQYCEIMRNCLRKFNVTPYGLTNNGAISKKQLLSTQKTLKTVGQQTSMSLQKKVLTMSANLPSNSKQSSSKGKSIKQQIFQYFNLQNLKVKNPTQPFSSISPINANNLNKNKKLGLSIQNNQIFSQSKEKHQQLKQSSYYQKQSQPTKQSYGYQLMPNAKQPNHHQYADKKLDQIYQRIKQIEQRIQYKQKQNRKLKDQICKKKKGISSSTISKQQAHYHHSTINSSATVNNNNALIKFNKINTQPVGEKNYFTRPSLEKQNKPPVNMLSSTQSNKKISYLEMSLNQNLSEKQKENFKSLMISSQHNTNTQNFNNNQNSQNTNYSLNNTSGHNNQFNAKVPQRNKNQNIFTTTSNKASSADNQFQKIDLYYCKNPSSSTDKQKNKQSLPQNTASSKWGNDHKQFQTTKNAEQRKCLVDISNFSNNQHQKMMKNNQYLTFNHEGSFKTSASSANTSTFQTINGNIHANSYHNNQISQQPHHSNTHTANSILYSKVSQQNQQSLSIIQSSKKLRSFSVQNSLADKTNNSYNTKNSNAISSGGTKMNHINMSFDNGNSGGLGVSVGTNHKKIKIPKLNLEILPNYHGKTNKSLNQSLMQIYEKKTNQTVGQVNE